MRILLGGGYRRLTNRFQPFRAIQAQLSPLNECQRKFVGLSPRVARLAHFAFTQWTRRDKTHHSVIKLASYLHR